MKLVGEKQLMRFEYDFEKDGGAVGVIVLKPAAGNLPEGCRILNAYAIASERLEGGPATVTFGINGDTDKYIADSYAELGGDPFMARQDDLDFLADANDVPVMEIAGAPLTGGKVELYLEVLS
ncbi:MAG: hypothetical protein KAJ19_09745 [Gammaproteobacteria bacterium]|nr:hypothetical protein [Gammaproteobacteria bacterium]